MVMGQPLSKSQAGSSCRGIASTVPAGDTVVTARVYGPRRQNAKPAGITMGLRSGYNAYRYRNADVVGR